jgi:hypothetical protein
VGVLEGPSKLRVNGSPTRLGMSGDASNSLPGRVVERRRRSPCMKNLLSEGAEVCAGRSSTSFFRFFRSAVLVGGEEGGDGEIKSEQSSTCSAAMVAAIRARAAEVAGLSYRGGVEGPRLWSSAGVCDKKSSISITDEAIPTAETGS